MAQAGAEILPEGGAGAGVIGGKQQRQHEDQAACACESDKDAEGARETDREFAVGDEERHDGGMRQDETSKDGHHEGIGAAFLNELVDPGFETAVKRELGAEDFVLAEDEEEDADADAEKS